MSSNVIVIVFALFVMVLSISLHDATQAWMANRLGDPTARMLGRITMNPMKHFTPFGMIVAPALAIFLFGSLLPYGWGLPVPTTYRNFPKKNGEMLSVLSGPAVQFFAATLALIILVILKHKLYGANVLLIVVEQLSFHGSVPVDLAEMPGIFPVLLLLYLSIMMNLLLCVFNLLPMPFLDGGGIIVHFLPYNAAKAFEQYRLYFTLAFLLIGGYLVSIVFVPLITIFTALLNAL
jgi:Zn-dependent protease